MLNNQKTYNLNQIKTRLSNSLMVLVLELSNECKLNDNESKKVLDELVKVNEWMNESVADDGGIIELINLFNYSMFRVLDILKDCRNIDFYDVKNTMFNILQDLYNSKNKGVN